MPREIPTDFSGLVADSLDLVIDGKPARAVLLEDSLPRQAAVSASVSNSPPSPPSGESRWVRLRSLFSAEDPALARLSPHAARALGIVNWHHATRFCGRCGSPLVDDGKELARRCPSCASLSFPRLSPAIIVVVERDGKILLARHSNRNQDVFSCLAGFVEHGETLEQCVAREVYEETSLAVRNVRYVGSQSWPFPDQYMIAFTAEWAGGEIEVDRAELLEARWFDRDNLPNTPMPGTVAWNLIHGVFAH